MELDVGGRKLDELPLSYSVDVNPWTGLASLRVAVPAPSGREAFGPALSLVYSSGSGNSEFGVGWTLVGIPAIGIDTSEHLPRWDNADAYQLAGSRLVPWLEQGSNGWQPRVHVQGRWSIVYYRTRLGSAQIRVEKWLDTTTGRIHFRTRDARNVLTVYGARPNAAARIADPDDEARTFTWLPELRVDPHGSAVWLDYATETLENVDASAPYEPSRPALAQRYLKSIRYSNSSPLELDDTVLAGTPPANMRWCFRTVFDYGDHAEPPRVESDRPWPVRADVASSTRPGFTVRTYRLCRRILSFHEFAELGPDPALVGELVLHHEHSASGTTLRELTFTGHRRNGTVVDSIDVPPLVMSYAPASTGRGFDSAPISTAQNAPAGLAARNTRFVDLFGEGLPGILTEVDRTWHYKQNAGGGTYAAETVVLERPAARDSAGNLGDLDRDGNTDLSELAGRLAGMYTLDRDTKQWRGFKPFSSFPRIEALGARARWVDLDGDGLLDVVIPKHDSLVWFASSPDGFLPPVEVPLPPGFEPTLDSDPSLDLFFADMNGDGAPDLVRVRNGSVEYWPSLGNGRFGERVVMDGAPEFASSTGFDASRLRFVDLDGSGTADLVYLGNGDVRCWTNASGNQLFESARIGGLPYLDNVSNVGVLDFLGDGRQCLVWSNPLPGRASPIEYIPLTGEVQPRQLLSVDDSRGCTWHLTYSSSAAHYLRDSARGIPWTSSLRTHYAVVNRLEAVDHIGNTRSVRRYEYHDGYYDGLRHQRRGFGRVDVYDGEEPAQTPASITRLWFHQGTELWRQPSNRYTGDAELPVLPAHTIDDPFATSSSGIEQGLRALAGLLIRRETWSYDRTSSTPTEHPYDVEQTTYQLRCEQPESGTEPAAFAGIRLQALTTTYEQRGDDPRMVHHITLATDVFGLPVRDVLVGYARRAGRPRDVAAQDRHQLTVNEHGLVSVDSHDRFELGIPVEARGYELVGIRPGPSPLFTITQLNAFAVVQALSSCALHDAVLSDDPALGARARLCSWQRTLYWNNARDAALPHGQLGDVVLVHHEETACFSDGFVSNVFGTRVDDARFMSVGYENRGGLWWVAGDVHFFAPRARFSRRVAIERSDGGRLTYEYDPYSLEIVAITDPLGNRTQAAIDYYSMFAARITDANGTVTELRHDALGIVVLATRRGHVGTNAWGFDALSAINQGVATNLEDLLSNPAAYLQGGALAFWYDLHAWRDAGTPPLLVSLRQETFRYDGEGHIDASGSIVTTISYFDGLRRVLQQKASTTAGPAIHRDAQGAVITDASGWPLLQHSVVRWRATGHVVYDSQQRPLRRFEPFFTPTAAYEDDEVLAQLGLATLNQYDAKGRLVREDFPDGTFARATYHAWSTDREDANDTILESTYRATRETLPTSDSRKQALEHAKSHAGTSWSRYVDPMGRDCGVFARGGTTAEDRHSEVEYSAEGTVSRVLDARGLVAFTYRNDMRGHQFFAHSVDAGDRRTLVDAYGRTRWQWTDRGHEIELGFDVVDRPAFTHVRGGDGPTPLDHRVHEWTYAESLDRATAAASNLLGRAISVRDASGETTFDRYDPDGNVLSSSRRFRVDIDNTPDWRTAVSLEQEVFSTAASYDASARAVRQILSDGSTRSHTYLPGGPLATTRISTSDGKLADVLVLADATCDARGRREFTRLGNGVDVRYGYGLTDGRLQTQVATLGTQRLQDLEYTFDPNGNLVRLTDAAQEGPAAILGGVTARRDYTHDAFGQIRTATGRIHQALLQHDYIPGTGGTAKGTRHLSLNNAAAVERYTEIFDYDASGNLRSMRHVGTSHSWTTDMWISSTSNRSLPAVDPNGNPVTNPESTFDATGNLLSLAHLRRMDWTWRGSLDRAVLIERPGGTDDDERYVYSADGMRARRVTTRLVSGNVVEVEEKLYFAGCERKRLRRVSNVLLERWSSHINDGSARIAIAHRWSVDQNARETDDVSRAQLRYQLVTHQGSSALELDQVGRVISYEEFLPYGSSAFIAGDSVREVALKEYRFSGKECDDATSLYYYGYRYYAPWMGRWLSPDPAGAVDGLNLYQFVLGNPITNVDANGLQSSGATLPPEIHNIAVRSAADMPEWARGLWSSLSEAQKLDVEERQAAIILDDSGARLVDWAEFQHWRKEHADADLNNYVLGAALANEAVEAARAEAEEMAASIKDMDLGMDLDGDAIADALATGGDSSQDGASGDGASGAAKTPSGPGAKKTASGSGTGASKSVTDGSGSGTATSSTSSKSGGTGEDASGTGAGSGTRGSGPGGGGSLTTIGTGGSGVPPASAGGLTPALVAGTGSASAGASGQKPSATAASGGSVGAATSTSGRNAGTTSGVAGGLEDGIEGGIGTHASDNAQHVDHPGEGGTGTQAGGSTDPNLSPSTTAKPNGNVHASGSESVGSATGSSEGNPEGTKGGNPDGSKSGSSHGTRANGGADGRETGREGGSDDEKMRGAVGDALDVMTRVAGMANMQFDLGKPGASGRGIPGARGWINGGWFGQVLYIVVTVATFLLPFFIFKKAEAKLLEEGENVIADTVADGLEHTPTPPEAPPPPDPPPQPSTPPTQQTPPTTSPLTRQQIRQAYRQHEADAIQGIRNANPGVNVGEQVTLDVTHQTTGQTVRIRGDALHAPNGGVSYKLGEAKWSGVNDLTTSDLENTLTSNQGTVFDWIRNGEPIEVVPRGAKAEEMGLQPGVPIVLDPSIDIYVNGPNGIVRRTF